MVYAFHDRHKLDDPWGAIYVVRGEQCVHLFDAKYGVDIDEADSPKGRVELETFEHEWSAGYVIYPVARAR